MEKTRKKCRNYILAADGIMLLISFGLLCGARKLPGFAEWYSTAVYPVLVGIFARFFGMFPFSAVELGLYGGVLFFLFLLIKYWRRPGLLIRVYGTAFSVLFLLYSTCCGVNYYRVPFSAGLGFDGMKVEKEELEMLCVWLTDRVNEAAKELPAEESRYENLEEKGRAAMMKLSKQYPSLAGYYPKPKPVLVSWILSIQQCSGVYSPFTVEANYNRDMVSYNKPHTICHELSHLRGFMREDEANFIGYLACLESEDEEFRYSGYLLGWIYAGNALAKENMEEYSRLYGMLDEAVKEDLRENSRFWDRYEGRAAEAADRVNDAYLKVNGQSEGILTYGRVVDLMIWDFVSNDSD